MRLKNIIFGIGFFISLFFSNSNLKAASGCQCLCSIFFTRGGETKLCPEEAFIKNQCTNWYLEIPKASSKKDCFTQGEDPQDCKGYFKEKTLKGSWTLADGGRLHSCKFY